MASLGEYVFAKNEMLDAHSSQSGSLLGCFVMIPMQISKNLFNIWEYFWGFFGPDVDCGRQIS